VKKVRRWGGSNGKLEYAVGRKKCNLWPDFDVWWTAL
jgi:hypothetical protein